MRDIAMSFKTELKKETMTGGNVTKIYLQLEVCFYFSVTKRSKVALIYVDLHGYDNIEDSQRIKTKLSAWL